MISPQDLFDVARHLSATSNEAHVRSAASRAYYAFFHQAELFHRSLPVPGRSAPLGAGGTHLNLAHQLANPAPEVTNHSADLAIKSRRIAAVLKNLKTIRVTADYEINCEFLPANVELILREYGKFFP